MLNVLPVLAVWLLVPATVAAIVILYRPRAAVTVRAVVEPRSHVRIVRTAPAPMASVVPLVDRRRPSAARHSA